MKLLRVMILACLIFTSCHRQAGIPKPGTDSSRQAEDSTASAESAETIPTGPPEIIQVVPSGEVRTSVTEVSITFSKPMVPLTAFEVPKEKSPVKLSCDFPGEWRWVNTTTLNYFFNAPVPVSTECEILISGDIRSEDGQMLGEDQSFKFETVRIEVVNTSPWAGDERTGTEGLSVTDLQQEIAITFNQPVVPKSLEKFGSFVQKDGREVDLEVVKISDREKELIQKGDSKVLEGKIGQRQVWIELLQRRDLSRTYMVRPEKKLDKNIAYYIKLDPGLQPVQGNLPSNKQFNLYYRTYPPFSSSIKIKNGCPEGCNPENPGYVEFTTPVIARSAQSQIKITPGQLESCTPNGCCDCTMSLLSLPAPLKTETDYVITISRDLKDVYGQSYEGPTEYSFKTGNLNPILWSPSGLGVMESKQEHSLPLKLRNLNSIRVRIKALDKDHVIPFYIDNMIRKGFDRRAYNQEGDYFYGEDWGDYIPDFSCYDILEGEEFTDKVVSFPLKKNVTWWEPLDFEKLLGQPAPGKFVYLDLSDPDPACLFAEICSNRTKPYRVSAIQLTDIGISAKIGYFNSLVWTTSLANGLPLPNSKVEIRNIKNRVLWRGTTDQNGMAAAPGKKDFYQYSDGKPEKTSFWVFAQNNEELSFLNNHWDGGISPWEFNINSTNFAYEENILAYAVIERPIYRPSDTVNYKVIVRSEQNAGLAAPLKDTVFVKVLNSRNEEFYTKEGKLNNYGTFEDSFQLGEDAKLGVYRLYIGYTKDKTPVMASFRVEEYRKPNLEIKIDPEKSQYSVGDNVAFNVSSRYHYGAPVKNAEVEYVLESRPSWFSPGKLSGYSTLNYLSGDQSYNRPNEVVDQGKFELDSEGKAVYIKSAPQKLKQGPAEYWLEVKIQDKDRRWVANRASVLVHPASFYLGIKTEDWGVESGKPIKLSLFTVGPNNEIVPGVKIKLSLVHRTWLTVREQRVAGFYHYESKMEDKVENSLETQSGSQPVTVEFTPKEGGYYIVVAEASDEKGNQVFASTDFYAWGGGYVSWERYDHDRIDLIAEKDEYQPGETARILVKNPYGDCQGILTVERKGILAQRMLNLKNGAELIEVPIKPEYAPNVYVSVLLVKGRVNSDFSEVGVDLGKPSMKIGYAALKVIDPGTKLAVNVNSNKDRFEPGQTCTLKMQVLNSNKQGQKAEIAVAVVDQALLQLVKERPYFPHDYFYASRDLDVDTADTRLAVIGRRHFGMKGVPEGGGGGIMGGEFRSKFVDSAFWKATVETDDKGFAEVSFKLPDNLTSFHVFAAANDSAQKFGTGEKVFQVSKPLMVIPGLPRFLMEKDSFLASAVVHNQTGKNQEVTLVLEAQGVELIGANTQKVSVKSGDAAELRFPVKAGTGGKEAVFKFRGQAGEFKDAVMNRLPILIGVPFDVYATYGSTVNSVREPILLPAGVRRDIGHLQIDVSSSMVTSLRGAFEYLFLYPYDCLEQNTSKAMMIMIYRDFKNRLKLDYVKQEDAERFVNIKWLKELPDYQRHSGSYDYWKIFGLYDQPWLTAYVCLALQYAKEGGYKIPEESYTKALDYLDHTVSYDSWPPYYNQKTRDATRPFMLLALARGGKLKPALLEPSIAVKDSIPPFSQACLLEAYARTRSKDKTFTQIHQAMFNHAEITSGRIHFDEVYDDGYAWILYSDVRSNAIILNVLNYLEPNGTFNYKLMRYLVESMKNSRWKNTQENMFAIWAITDYLKTSEAEKPDFTVKARLENQPIFEMKFTDYKAEPAQKKESLAALPVGQKISLFMDKKGPGRMYYRLELSAAKTEPENRMVNAGVQISRQYKAVEATSASEGFARSKIVQVTLTITVPRERHFLVITDRLPAGLEPMNLELETEEQSASKYLSGQTETYRDAASYEEWQYWYTAHWQRHVEMHDERVTVYTEYLPAGTYTFVYLARATSSGQFFAPAPSAEEMYEPETYGRGLFQNFEIK